MWSSLSHKHMHIAIFYSEFIKAKPSETSSNDTVSRSNDINNQNDISWFCRKPFSSLPSSGMMHFVFPVTLFKTFFKNFSIKLFPYTWTIVQPLYSRSRHKVFDKMSEWVFRYSFLQSILYWLWCSLLQTYLRCYSSPEILSIF